MSLFEEQLPRWEEPGIEPPEGKQTGGWEVGEKPPAGWFNWLSSRAYACLVELRTVAEGVATSIGELVDKFHGTTGHGHIGGVGDGPQIKSSGIADSAVTEAKIGSLAVTADKIATGAVIASKIADGGVDTLARIASGIRATTATPNTIAVRDAAGRIATVDGVAAGDAATKGQVDAKPSLGETSVTAYRGDRGKIAYDHSQTPHDGESLVFNHQTANYVLALEDAGRCVTMTNTSARTITVPTNATVAFPIGTQILLGRLGTGAVTIVPASGVTINAASGLKLWAQYSMAGLIKQDTHIWMLVGDLEV